MPMSTQEINDLKSMIPAARKKPIAFGLCLGRSDPESVLLLDRVKSPEVLGRTAKKIGGGPKVTFGLASISGKNLVLECFEEIPPGCDKSMRNFLKSIGTPMIVETTQGEPPNDAMAASENADAAAEDTKGAASSPWQAARQRLEPHIEDAITANHPKAANLQKAWSTAVGFADQDKERQAMAVVSKIEALLDAGAAKPAAAKGKDTAIYQKTRALWTNTRNKMRAEMAKLQAAMTDACDNAPDMAPLLKEIPELEKRLAVFDVELDDKLGDLVQSEAGSSRDVLLAQARTVVNEYEVILNKGFFADVDARNGFTKVAVTSTARSSLASISKVLM